MLNEKGIFTNILGPTSCLILFVGVFIIKKQKQ